MGRICIPSNQHCEIQFFSIADEVQNMFNNFLAFVLNITPGIWALIILTGIGALMLYIFMAVKRIGTMK